jgi:hypothetical protein
MILLALLALQAVDPAPPAAPVAAARPALAKPDAPKRAPAVAETPMAERVVTLAALNKRNGRSETFTAKPGEAVTFDALSIRVRACETTPPTEQRLTGAFLQIDERLRTGNPRRLYSGWMYAESASLHPLEHPLYDVWVRSCAMSFPATGPDTVAAGKALVDKDSPAKVSSAKNSPTPASAPSN